MYIHQLFTHSSLRNFTYIIEFSKNQAICIDPYDSNQVLDFLEEKKLHLVSIFNTHEHWDHCCGNEGLVKQSRKLSVYTHPGGKESVPCANKFLNHGEIFPLDEDYYLEILHTPGHTFAHLSLSLKKGKKQIAIFTGDTIFNAGVGNCHNGGDPKTLYETVTKYFLSMPDDVLLYPGHEYLMNNLKFTLDGEPSNKSAKELLEKVQELNNSDKEFIVTNFSKEREINSFFKAKDEKTFLTLREKRNKW